MILYGLLGFLLGIVVTIIVECVIVRRVVKGNEKKGVKHQSISEVSRHDNGSSKTK